MVVLALGINPDSWWLLWILGIACMFWTWIVGFGFCQVLFQESGFFRNGSLPKPLVCNPNWWFGLSVFCKGMGQNPELVNPTWRFGLFGFGVEDPRSCQVAQIGCGLDCLDLQIFVFCRGMGNPAFTNKPSKLNLADIFVRPFHLSSGFQPPGPNHRVLVTAPR